MRAFSCFSTLLIVNLHVPVIASITNEDHAAMCGQNVATCEQNVSPVKASSMVQKRSSISKGMHLSEAHDTTPDAQITFQGMSHASFFREVADANLQNPEMRRVLRRPEWSTMYRCRASGDCEPCGETPSSEEEITNCWTAGSNRRVLLVKDNTEWAYFENRIELVCGGENAVTSLRVVPKNPDGMRNGSLTVLWDGVELTEANGFEKVSGPDLPVVYGNEPNGHFRLVTKMPAHADSHTLTVRFTPSQPNALAVLRSLQVYVADEFAQCEDTEACLEELIVSRAGAVELRTDNTKQLECLEMEHPEPDTACDHWRFCLERTSDRADLKLLGILRTVLRGSEEASALQGAAATATLIDNDLDDAQAADEDCVDPMSFDWLSYLCTCYNASQELCEGEVQERIASDGRVSFNDGHCFNAILCLYTGNVCDPWLAGNCHSYSVQVHMNVTREPLNDLLRAYGYVTLFQDKVKQWEAERQNMKMQMNARSLLDTRKTLSFDHDVDHTASWKVCG